MPVGNSWPFDVGGGSFILQCGMWYVDYGHTDDEGIFARDVVVETKLARSKDCVTH